MSLVIVPCTIKAARAYVQQHHRHHPPPLGGLFAAGVSESGVILVGVAIVGRPGARLADDGFTAEVSRVATDGTANACSALYGACWRAARALGWRRLITYTLASESGASLRASGWRVVGEVRPQSWSRIGRPRVDRRIEPKIKWEAGRP